MKHAMKTRIGATIALILVFFTLFPQVGYGPGKAFAQATLLPPGEQCFQALTATSGGPQGNGTGFIGLLGNIIGGSGGTTGTYTAPLTGGQGANATANFTVSGGAVTAVAIVNAGVGYGPGDVLSATPATIGNVSGFSVSVSSIAINQSIAGGSVGYYVPGTSTFKQTWFNADQASNHQNTNPVQLDANGCAIVYGSGIYRQVLQDSLGNTIWDQITASTNQNNPYWANLAGGTPNNITVVDTAFAGVDGQIVGFIPLSTNTGSTNITLSGSGPYQIVKDTSAGAEALTGGEIVANSPSNVVYLSYSATQNNFHIINLVQPSASAAPIQPPQGYLTLQNIAGGGPVQGANDITGASTVYYSPYIGNQIPIWNGSSFSVLVFPELTLNVSSSAQSASTAYDACVFNNAGTPTAVFGPAWSVSSGASASRGTGAGSTQLTRLNGIWVNAVSIAANNGSSTFTVPALQCTYVGSVLIDASAGQISNYRTWGQSRKWGVWNAYWRVPIYLQAGDSTASWGYTTATIRPSHGSTANSLITFVGLPEEATSLSFTQLVIPTQFVSQSVSGTIGFGYNSTTAFSGTTATFSEQSSGSFGTGTFNVGGTITAIYQPPIGIGAQTVTALEVIAGTDGATFIGTQADMLLSALWRG